MSIRDQITAYANQYGLDPAWALAVAERESSFNPAAHASKTIHGLFQMSGAVRDQYGVPMTNDVGTQVRGFAQYSDGLYKDMASRLGRAPTPSELYLGHYWGPARAAGVVGGHYDGLTAKDVFTPRELAENPNLKPDASVTDLAGGITNDMNRRYAKFGGQGGAVASGDLTEFGAGDDDTKSEPAPAANKLALNSPTSTNSADFTSFGTSKSADDPVGKAIDSMAENESEKDNPLSDLASGLGKFASNDQRPKAPPQPQSTDDIYAALAARQAVTPISGVGSMPGQQANSNQMLPGSMAAQPPGFNPAMFGIAQQG